MDPNRLFSAIRAQRVPHAILFSGPMGSGRKRLALEAAALCCTGSRDISRLESCPNFHLYGPNRIPIDDIRALKDQLSKRAFGEGRRCVVLLNAHLMKAEAQHALLKTIEEPPAHTLFCLTGEEETLLPTIRSRCAILRLGASSVDEAAQWLEENGLPPQDARQLAAQAEGFAPLALKMREADYVQLRRDALMLFDAALSEPLAPFQSAKQLLDRVQGDVGTPTQQKIAYLSQCASVWLSQARDLLILKADTPVGLENPDRKKKNLRFAQSFTIAQINDMINLFLRIRKRLVKEANPALTMDLALMELSRLARSTREEICKP